MAETDLDCDICGMSVYPDNHYALSVTHGNLKEDFDFCSMACLSRWVKQYTEDHRKATTEKLESALSSEDEDSQDLEEEVEEHDGSPHAAHRPSSYGESADGASTDSSYGGTGERYEKVDPFGDLAEEVNLDTGELYEGKIGPTPITDHIEEMDPVEKGKREREEQSEKERKELQDDFDGSKER